MQKSKSVNLPVAAHHPLSVQYQFADEPTKHYIPCVVEPDGSVLVEDPIAQALTSCHSLTQEQCCEARRLAGVEVAS